MVVGIIGLSGGFLGSSPGLLCLLQLLDCLDVVEFVDAQLNGGQSGGFLLGAG